MATGIKTVDPSQNEYLAELEQKSKKENRFFRTMANRPDVLKNFVPLYSSVMTTGSVNRRIKELVYLACSYANECPYCSASHTNSGKKAGLTDDELQALRLEQDHGFSNEEKAAVRFARELTRTADAEESRDDLYQLFDDEQIVEITLVAAMANFTNRFNNALGVQPEE
jgi:uncharacterized peroxidase-related enzyme